MAVDQAVSGRRAAEGTRKGTFVASLLRYWDGKYKRYLHFVLP
jgi:hypothetical protein